MNHDNNLINVSFWNANSIRTKIHEHYDFLNENEIDVSCIQETMLKTSDNVHSHPNYILYRNDREIDESTRASGGVAIFIRKSIVHQLIPLPRLKVIEAIGIELILTNGEKIQIWSVYLPGGTDSATIRRNFRSDLMKLINRSSSYFINGDLNSKHRFWNCARANTAGNILYNELQQQNFLLLYPPNPTHYSSNARCTPATIDLTITNGLHDTSDLVTHAQDSDHRLISYSINLTQHVRQRLPKKIPLFSQANWMKYKIEIDNRLSRQSIPDLSQIRNEQEIDELISNFTDIIMDAQRISVPLVTPTPYAVVLTSDIKQMIQSRNILRRRLQRNPGLNSILSPNINQLTKKIQFEINRIVNENFNHKLSQIDNTNQYQQLWKTSKFLKNRNKQIPPLKVNALTLLTPEEKSEAFAQQFQKNHENPLETNNNSHTRLVNRTVNRFITNSQTEDENFERIDETEVKKIVRGLKTSKAPGIDKIHNSLMKRLPPMGFTYLTFIMNACMYLSYFPKPWKAAKVIAIKKPGKPTTLPSSYRPISLLSSLSKVFERVILARLNAHMNMNRIIPHQQHGFRSGYSTITQLHNLKCHIKQSLENRLSTGLILMDIEKAFDRVWHNGLIYKLIRTNTPQYIIRIIYSFLQNRTFEVVVESKTSSQLPVKYGLPQGAVLSPTLYNVYTHDLPIPEDCKIALFADDTAFYTSSRYAKTIIRSLEKTAKKLYRYFTKWKIVINQDKTQAIFFTNRRTKQLPQRKFKFDTSEIEWETTAVKYLGIYFDKRITFKKHIDYVIKKAFTAIRILYSMFNRKSRLQQACKVLLYKVAIRPIVTYGAPVFNSMAQTHKKKLQTVQNKILKMILNVPWLTSTVEIHERSQIETVTDFMNRLTTNFENRLQLVSSEEN